jgi:hypothetical protein
VYYYYKPHSTFALVKRKDAHPEEDSPLAGSGNGLLVVTAYYYRGKVSVADPLTDNS